MGIDRGDQASATRRRNTTETHKVTIHERLLDGTKCEVTQEDLSGGCDGDPIRETSKNAGSGLREVSLGTNAKAIARLQGERLPSRSGVGSTRHRAGGKQRGGRFTGDLGRQSAWPQGQQAEGIKRTKWGKQANAVGDLWRILSGNVLEGGLADTVL